MNFMQFRADTYYLSYRKGNLTDTAQIKYSAAIYIKFETNLSATMNCDLFADRKLLDFANAKIYITFNGGKMLRIFSARETLYRGIVFTEVSLHQHQGNKK